MKDPKLIQAEVLIRTFIATHSETYKRSGLDRAAGTGGALNHNTRSLSRADLYKAWSALTSLPKFSSPHLADAADILMDDNAKPAAYAELSAELRTFINTHLGLLNINGIERTLDIKPRQLSNFARGALSLPSGDTLKLVSFLSKLPRLAVNSLKEEDKKYLSQS